ncbi:hypothetical protein HN51_002844 [Arachis hypogaea]|uniref:Wax synthase domain-containing protein n=1 Tax=Arachis hypogaea TaxID=3818 RepID=A0A445ELC7_ARAHY|nr:acyl-CoA--sterol O-acyltransferase 1-like [Arachis hypogaea]QHO51093.1 Acyl-CoA--sterol O-acyltransferase [Arachis hypogaea]RYR76133.1 hypothetical protein Ahy_A01g000724 [Arachis hypogaea]
MIEGEVNNFIMVWMVATASFCYSHAVGKLVTNGGKARLVALFPAIVLLFLLPLRLTSAHLGPPSTFLLGWLSTFKLLLFAFHKGPLSSNPPLSLPYFLILASLPITFQHLKDPNSQTIPDPHNNKTRQIYRLGLMAILSACFFPLYGEKQDSFYPVFTLLLISLHMYVSMELVFGLASVAVSKLLHIKLDPHFDKPYLSTSLQDFWGRRWNIMVNRVLHPTVYDPVVRVSSHVVGRKWAPLPAVMATFAVSGLMHELVFYSFKREKPNTLERWEPSWDSLCFFLIHGACLTMEIGVKKKLGGRWRVPKAVSLPLTVAFVVSTGLWLFVPALARCGAFVKGKRESLAVVDYVRTLALT